MQKMGLNTYMYAPKDDCKHRAHWRDLYSVEEAGEKDFYCALPLHVAWACLEMLQILLIHE